MKTDISYFFEDVDEIDLPTGFEPWLAEIATSFKKPLTLTYIFCNDEQMLEINRQYLNHDYYTDIITFDLSDDNEVAIEADIFISLDTVFSNSQKENNSFADELCRVMAHGVFHLLGFDDKTDQQKKEMRRLEDEAIRKMN